VLKLFGGVFSWMSRKQFVVFKKKIEDEYIIATHESKEAVWLEKLCSVIRIDKQAIRLGCYS